MPVLSCSHQSREILCPTQRALECEWSVSIGGVSIRRTHVEFWHMYKVLCSQKKELVYSECINTCYLQAQSVRKEPVAEAVWAQHVGPGSCDANVCGLFPIEEYLGPHHAHVAQHCFGDRLVNDDFLVIISAFSQRCSISLTCSIATQSPLHQTTGAFLHGCATR